MRDIDFSKLTILVVEDQAYVRNLIVQLLHRLGVTQVLEESDGTGALNVLSASDPDLVLCDIKMRPVDGLQLLSAVRSGKNGIRNSRVPVVFLTSDSEHGTVMAAIEQEVDGYLIKPVSLTDLKAKIASVLTGRQIPAK